MTLPVDDVVTRDEVKALSGLTTSNDDALIDEVCLAVDEFVRALESVRRVDLAASWPLGDDDEPVWPTRFRLGARMLAARLYRRKNSPEGVATFVGEGVAYVRRADPDVASLLRLSLPAAG